MIRTMKCFVMHGIGKVGVIHELGELAAASGLFKIGQPVAVSAITPCDACDNCQRGYPEAQ